MAPARLLTRELDTRDPTTWVLPYPQSLTSTALSYPYLCRDLSSADILTIYHEINIAEPSRFLPSSVDYIILALPQKTHSFKFDRTACHYASIGLKDARPIAINRAREP
jgi:hypothetical protein